MSGATPARTLTVPSSGISTPAIRLSRVDLPWPFLPTTPIASPGAMSKLTCRNGQNSLDGAPVWPLISSSRTLRCRRRFRENCTPTSRNEMMGSATGRSDLLEHGTFQPGEHHHSDNKYDDAADRGVFDVLPAQLLRKERRAKQNHDPGNRVDRSNEAEVLRDVVDAVQDRREVEPHA